MRAIKLIISGFLVLGVCLIPLTIPLMIRPSWGQSRNLQEKIQGLIELGLQQTEKRQPQQAIETLQQALAIARQIKDRTSEGIALLGIGVNYHYIGQPQQALNYLNQAVSIYRKTSDRIGEAVVLNNIAEVYRGIGQTQQALEFYKQTLPIFRALGERRGEATTLNNIGQFYKDTGQPQQALDFYNQALPIFSALSDLVGKATTLNNIGAIYDDIGQPQRALEFYNQALPLFQTMDNRGAEATTLNNIGLVHSKIGQSQRALEFYNQALPLLREVGDRSVEATTLNNIATVYRDTNRPTEAITYYEQAVEITLNVRGDLQRQNRQNFLQSKKNRGIALISLLIDQNQPEKAFEWANLATTADLADYTRLINAKVSNPQAQQLIDQWNQKNQQIQFLYNQVQSNPSDQLSRQINAFQEENNKLAEEISRQFPEVAELFETKPTDIEKLRASIPEGTVVIQPVLLTNVKNVPNTVAIFILTKDQISVIKKAIDPIELGKLLTQYREQLQNYNDPNYTETSAKLYNILIRPVEDKIKAFSPKQLSIIATGELRYIPFETLYDEQTDQFLIQKYPINYLTRLSSRSLSNVNETFLQRSILALGNPITEPPYYNMPDAPEEVESITQLLPSSQVYIGKTATLETFKTQAPRFSILHLATHGCFQPEGCCLPKSPDCRKPDKVDLKPNTILFADQQLNIADAALLGLQNTELLTLSACQTAMQANSNGEEIAGVAYIFERAGAKAVMASLWNAEDKATKDIMVQFYQNIKNGMSKGEALQKAKLSQIKRHPFYWSPFILIGDAR